LPLQLTEVASAIAFAVIVIATITMGAAIAIAVGVTTVGVAAFLHCCNCHNYRRCHFHHHCCHRRRCLQIANMMSEETDLTTGSKSTSGKKTSVKKIAREVSEGLGNIHFLNISHLM
jgi:hypothetical protein